MNIEMCTNVKGNKNDNRRELDKGKTDKKISEKQDM